MSLQAMIILLRALSSLLWWQGPWIFWSFGIFYLSSLGRVPSIPLFPVSDKVVHAFTYFILALLTLRAFRHWPGEHFRRLCFVWAFIFCILYGASDEWHQLFVPGRTCDVKDWFADAAGAFAALMVYFGFQKIRATNKTYVEAKTDSPKRFKKRLAKSAEM